MFVDEAVAEIVAIQVTAFPSQRHHVVKVSDILEYLTACAVFAYQGWVARDGCGFVNIDAIFAGFSLLQKVGQAVTVVVAYDGDRVLLHQSFIDASMHTDGVGVLVEAGFQDGGASVVDRVL